MDSNPKLMTIADIAKFTGMSGGYVRSAIKAGKIAKVKRLKLGRNSKFFVDRAAVENWWNAKLYGRKKDRFTEKWPTVYAIECAGFVKIGWTSNLALRVKHLTTANPLPLRVLGAIDGTRGTEQEFHRMFAKKQENGEWFKLSQDDLETIKTLFLEREGKWHDVA